MVKLVGILNVTPDSFSDGGQFNEPLKALAHAEQLFRDGADFIDIGAESTKPGASPLTPEEEWQRLEPILPELIKRYPSMISLDTYHPETAQKALTLDGRIIINDITGLQNPAMFRLVMKNSARCIVGHMPHGDAQLAHSGELTTNMQVVIDALEALFTKLTSAGMPAKNIILDPCIGFGKTPELNRQLLEIPRFLPGKHVMIGYSRKRFLGEHRMELEPNLAAAKIAIDSGAAYLRVHDVSGHAKHLGLL